MTATQYTAKLCGSGRGRREHLSSSSAVLSCHWRFPPWCWGREGGDRKDVSFCACPGPGASNLPDLFPFLRGHVLLVGRLLFSVCHCFSVEHWAPSSQSRAGLQTLVVSSKSSSASLDGFVGFLHDYPFYNFSFTWINNGLLSPFS